MRRTYVRIAVLLALAGLVGWAVIGKIASSSQASTKKDAGSESGAKEVLVTTYKVEPTTLEDTLSTVGTLRADESLVIRNEVNGKVVSIGFQEGERVEKGQLLLRMRQNTLRAEKEVLQQRKKLLAKQVERQRQVLETGGISQQEFDATQNELNVVEAQMASVEARLDETVVRAPFAGIVGLRDISPGAVLTQGTDIAELHKIDPIELDFSVPERFAHHIDKETTVRFRVQGGDRVYSADVFALDPSLDASNRTLRVRARTDNPSGRLRPGGYAQVRVPLTTIEQALTVPTTAITTSGQTEYVWVSDDGTARRQTVRTGLRTEDVVEVTDGLKTGDVVVTTGRQNVSEGAKLKVDTSKDAMDVEAIGPDPDEPGMTNKRLSEEELDEGEGESDSDDANAEGSQ